jgi:hypothetical protein
MFDFLSLCVTLYIPRHLQTPIGRFLALSPIAAVQRKSPTLKSIWICVEWQQSAKSSKNRLNR